jgi:hypothetical protein
MQPGDIDLTSGKTVLKVIKNKHPEMMLPYLATPEWLSFKEYDKVPTETFINCDK